MRPPRPPCRVLVVGQTPPPFGGQAMMIERLLGLESDRVVLHHVRMGFSDDMENVGRFAAKKLWVLLTTITRIWWVRFRHRTSVLYYPPSGPNLIPVLRDIVLLGSTRWLFRHVVFHFHAAGVSEFADEVPAAVRPLFRLAYRRPELAIRTAVQNPDDGAALGAKNRVVIPYGVEDMRGTVPERSASVGDPLTILFTGVLIPSKGVGVLLEAFEIVIRNGLEARLQVMGKWGDIAYQRECESFLRDHGISDRVEFLGVRTGLEKFESFAACDVFCFPSYFESESFGLVLLEAMQFAKPVVATDWRGIPSVVAAGETGLLVPVHEPRAVADSLEALANDPDLRRSLGEAGRRKFERDFSLRAFHTAMERELLDLCESGR